MKFFISLFVIAAITVSRQIVEVHSQPANHKEAAYGADSGSSHSAPASAPAHGGSGNAGSSYAAPAAPSYQASAFPAPPCAKNYLFSCQPTFSPVACGASSGGHGSSSGGYGSAGAYSHYYPTHAIPQGY